jgi:hypothetical protein
MVKTLFYTSYVFSLPKSTPSKESIKLLVIFFRFEYIMLDSLAM